MLILVKTENRKTNNCSESTKNITTLWNNYKYASGVSSSTVTKNKFRKSFDRQKSLDAV